MPRINLDASDVQSFEQISGGTYEAKIAEVQAVKQGEKAQYVPVVFEITDGEHMGRKLWRNYTIEGPGLGFFIRDVNKILGPGTLEAGEITEFDTDDLLEAPCRIVVEEDEYNGEPTNNVTRVLTAA